MIYDIFVHFHEQHKRVVQIVVVCYVYEMVEGTVVLTQEASKTKKIIALISCPRMLCYHNIAPGSCY